MLASAEIGSEMSGAVQSPVFKTVMRVMAYIQLMKMCWHSDNGLVDPLSRLYLHYNCWNNDGTASLSAQSTSYSKILQD
jgi:hypothetical protein